MYYGEKILRLLNGLRDGDPQVRAEVHRRFMPSRIIVPPAA
jgi:hypothetical protein